jgi:3-oxoacyl-[acyl-carrier protein] reductase
MRLANRVAVVTGAARGIGFAVAQRFVREGARVALWDVQTQLLEEAVARLRAEGGQVLGATVDVTDQAAVAAAYTQAEAELGQVHTMVANAGITRDAMLHKMTDDAWDKVIDVNLKGVFVCGREAGTRMREHGGGCILVTSSIVGRSGNIGQTNYAATKAGVIAMTQTWARELGPKGVRVNAVAPGFIRTEMTLTVPEKLLTGLADKTPLRRLGEPQEIAAAFAFLASDDASYISGQVLGVDGGLSL